MKKTVIASVAFAAALFAVSCQKENNPAQNVSGPMTISAVATGIDIPATKTSLAFKYDVNWNQDDKIYVTDGSNKNTFTLQSGAGTPKGSFVQEGSEKTFTGEVRAYYPSTMVDAEISGNVMLKWPADQENDQTIPMYCKKTLSSGGQGEQRMDFSSLGSVLRIAFTTPVSDIKLKSITIKDDETKMSGNFNVDETGKAIIDETYGTNSITLDLGDVGVDVSNKINYFNIAVPAGHYQKFSITFTATDGKLCVMTGGNINIDHNTVGTLSLTGEEFKPFGQGAADVKAEAGIQGNKVKWIQLWENGPKFAEVNVGVTDGKAENYGGYYACGADDTATALWGENWRMPTDGELQDLIDKCTVEWTTVGGVYGRKFTGKGAYAFNSVFLPAAGNRMGDRVDGQGSYGFYWSSTYMVSYQYYLLFESDGQYMFDDWMLWYDYSVRAVLAKED